MSDIGQRSPVTAYVVTCKRTRTILITMGSFDNITDCYAFNFK
jgi:hypothetical protein